MSGFLELGHEVEPLRLKTVRGSAMPAVTMVFDPAPDPATVGELVFANGAIWAAVVEGAEMTWTATAAQVDAQPDGTPVRLRIDGTVYAIGEVEQHG